MAPSAMEPTLVLPAYQASHNGYDPHLNFTPPPLPKSTQVPKDLKPSILEAKKHPKSEQIVEEVNAFFLANWPFRTDKQRQRFVDEGYAWFVCVNCPLSKDDRLHWGCRLLTTGFLIDDVLDRMSVEDGVVYNDKIIACVRGTRLPDQGEPAQKIMYDLFQSMRGVDYQLAEELVQPTVDFLLAQVDGDRMKPMNLKEYFLYRDADLGKGLLTGIMRFCAGMYMTPEEMTMVKEVEENSMKHITFVNDICSYEKEVLAAKDGFELGSICSSVPIVMDLLGVNEAEAKRNMWQMARSWEITHFEMVDQIKRKNQGTTMAFYLKGLEHQIAGNELWSLLTPRYNRTGSLAFTEGR